MPIELSAYLLWLIIFYNQWALDGYQYNMGQPGFDPQYRGWMCRRSGSEGAGGDCRLALASTAPPRRPKVISSP